MSITPALSDGDFSAPAFYMDWAEHHDQGPLPDTSLPWGVTAAGAVYQLTNAEVQIDISAGRQLSVSRSRTHLFEGSLPSGESVLLGDNVVDRPPVLLRFRKPLRSVGARVSGSATAVGVPYWAQCQLLLSDGRWYPVPSRKAVLDSSRADAPFMGATANPGRTIRAAWFDILNLSTPDDTGTLPAARFLQVAIGDLYFVP